ncbi:VOC family protein [Rhodococcus sp. BP-252]|uniref:Glyoxalase n=1 Tax=Rhodococcoides kyotonense TaxID=398843 RepID=A0A177Y7Q4_9NOCA|nr:MULTISPECIES: VOC family protein [Rhodococcus]MBY6413481.1 VOC family protein [Rhodococcus sp. BP-320]MBY6418175.1 VOC family protein [Rhodococcus sp. BP-321]MBY6422344.1 VOC family protein [Rhodococcus sp. BP-324]MBY6428675.1 VOC family protein [Rhodococcus sp. BP-323]MBY6433681.1 VOC family protein [Rhodococcus sp. BP-322]
MTLELTRSPFSGFAVDDIEAARSFYADTLGMTVVDGEMGLIHLRLSENSEVLVYPRPGHTPAPYTILNFPVADIEAAVDALTAKGVVFQQYPDMGTDERGIFRGGGPLIAWFTDPAGNVLSVLEA